MDKKLRELQLEVLKVVAKASTTFALAGGTALEIYYLQHRFSRDLDFFSPNYSQKEINNIRSVVEKNIEGRIVLENKLEIANKAQVQFYTISSQELAAPLKLDFVEDVLFKKPKIRKFNKVPVYDVQQIYLQKIVAITGVVLQETSVGREVTAGRQEARDIVDIYYLSKKIKPLNKILAAIPGSQQRGVVQWYQSFSRMQFKLDFLDLDIYDKKIDSREIIYYLEKEVKIFMEEEIL